MWDGRISDNPCGCVCPAIASPSVCCPRCSGEIREVKILKDGVRHGLWQCDKDGSLRFYYHDKINDGEDFQAAYTAPSGDTVRHISASSRAGFLVVRVVETPNMVKYYHNYYSQVPHSELSRNAMLKKVRHLRDSSSLINHKDVRKTLALTPALIQSDLKKPDGTVQSYQFKDGSLWGFGTAEGSSPRKTGLTRTDGSSAGFNREYKDDKLIRFENGSYANLYGYNGDGKLIELNSYSGDKLHYATSIRYENGLPAYREFQNVQNKKRVSWNFTYHPEGRFQRIEKTEGRKKTVLQFDYAWW